MRTRPTALAAFVLIPAALMIASEDAEACGGLFCDTVQPVVQVDERIIFVDHEDDTVTAVVQIAYQGPSEQFAWVLPVPGVPEVSVSSNQAFTRLQTATDPSWTLERRVEGECGANAGGFAFGCQADAQALPSNAGPSDDRGGEVNVVGGGSVGPYDYEVISTADIMNDDPAVRALEWLEDNGYESSALGGDLIRPYLEDGMNLIAFRLQKNASVGEIRPVVMRYESLIPMIPIKLTAVAAEDDMGVLVWTVAGARGVAQNYRSLELNPALINWFNWRSSYFDVINAAADEAGGHGFVTEMARDSANVSEAVWSTNDQSSWTNMQERDWSQSKVALMDSVTTTYRGFDGLTEAARVGLALDNTELVDSILGCPSCDSSFSAINAMDTAVFLDALETNVIEPMRETQALLVSRPKIARLYTTLSPSEMTEDPIFDFNTDLPDIEAARVAPQIVECNLSVSEFEAPWRVELPTGQVVRGTGFGWPISTGDMPANQRVLQIGVEGPGEIIVDNTDAIETALVNSNSNVVAGAGCHAFRRQGGLAEMATFSLLVLLGRTLLRRRARQGPRS